jgi:cyanate permease
MPAEVATHSERVPISRLIGTRAVWASSFGHFAVTYGFYFLLAWLPLYLVKQRGFSLETMTLLATMVYATQAVSALGFGWQCDRLTAAGRNQGQVARIQIVIAIALLGIAITGIAFATDTDTLIACLLLAGIGAGPCATNTYVIAQIFAGPRGAGTYVGVQNALGNASGIVGPIVTGMIVDATGNFLNAFILAAGVCAAGAICWAWVVPRIEPVPLD